MVDNTQFQPQNPYALFSPDQWLNQFSNFNNKALPWPSSYAGMPTDAMGQPIQPPPGTTLNSAPAAPPAAPAAAAPSSAQNMFGAGSPLNPSGNMAFAAANWGGFPASGIDTSTPGGYLQALQANPVNQALNGPQKQAAQPAPAAPTGPTYPQILSMLANPGKVTTPGANVAQSPTSAQPGSANLQSFLQNWKPASSGPGSGFQQNFATALKGMGY